MKRTILYIFSLILVACRKEPCISEEQATSLIEQGRELELASQPQAARMKYKEVDLFICKTIPLNSSLRSEAFNNAVRLQREIETSYINTMSALETYYTENGRYPDSLDEISNDIPKRSKAAFVYFQYSLDNEKKVSVTTGLYGNKSFDLNNK